MLNDERPTDPKFDARPDARTEPRTEARPDTRPDAKAKFPEKPRSHPGRRRTWTVFLLILVIAATVAVTFYVRSCQENTAPKMNSPGNVAFLMTKALRENNFADFQSLLTEQARLQIDSNQFGTFQKLNTDKALYGTYALVRLENGRLIMVYMTPPDSEGNFKIQDVKIVPAEMNTLFNHAK